MSFPFSASCFAPFPGSLYAKSSRGWAVCILYGTVSVCMPFLLSFQVQVSGDKYTLHSQPLHLSKHNLTCVAISLVPYQIMRPDQDKRFYNPCCLCFCQHSPAETANNYHQRQRESYTLSIEVPMCMLSSSRRRKSREEIVPDVACAGPDWALLPARESGRVGSGASGPLVADMTPRGLLLSNWGGRERGGPQSPAEGRSRSGQVGSNEMRERQGVPV